MEEVCSPSRMADAPSTAIMVSGSSKWSISVKISLSLSGNDRRPYCRPCCKAGSTAPAFNLRRRKHHQHQQQNSQHLEAISTFCTCTLPSILTALFPNLCPSPQCIQFDINPSSHSYIHTYMHTYLTNLFPTIPYCFTFPASPQLPHLFSFPSIQPRNRDHTLPASRRLTATGSGPLRFWCMAI